MYLTFSVSPLTIMQIVPSKFLLIACLICFSLVFALVSILRCHLSVPTNVVLLRHIFLVHGLIYIHFRSL